ncbi:hypothetical protein AB0B88_16205 [Micromonospora haikouensis]|uniref:hypothetical protein n=1 Tax=Micromonospora haikouensis TaxID=686309 RepID=UPI0033CC1E95
MAAADRERPGKIAAVDGLLQAYAPEVEADLADRGIDLRDLWRRGGGASRLTYRRLAVLLEQLPPESRTKTAQRDDLDPVELARHVAAMPPSSGWGPHGPIHELLMRVGESIEWLRHDVAKAVGGKPKEPVPWRRPGVLGRQDMAAIEAEQSAPVVADLEAERAARAARRAEAKQAQQQGGTAS